MRIWSDDFGEGEPIPVKQTKDGDNRSPSIRWTDLPGRTRELAVMLEGITPSTRPPWVHWLAYGIPANTKGLPAGLNHRPEPVGPLPVRQGKNGLGNVGYDGPQGTVGRTFRYRLKVVALDRALNLPPGVDKTEFDNAARGHVVGEAEMLAYYERPG